MNDRRDEDSGDKNSGSKNSGGKNSGGKNSGGKNSGGKNSGGKNFGDGNWGDGAWGDGALGDGALGGRSSGGERATPRPPAAGPPSRVRPPLLQLMLARVLEFLREPAAIFWVYVFPLMMMLALGAAFRQRGVEPAAVCVAAGGRGPQIAETLLATERFELQLLSLEECRRLLRTGRADLLIIGEAGDADGEAGGAGGEAGDDAGGEAGDLRFEWDPSRPGSQLAREAANDALQRAAGRRDPLPVQDLTVAHTGGRYIDFLVPGLIGMGLMGGGLWGVGFAIVDLRIRKLLKRLLATPMRRSHFLGSVLLSRLLFTLPEVLVLLLAARLMFHVQNQGSYLTLGALIFVGAFEFAGIGLLVACRAKTLETVSGLMNLVMLPMWVAGGIFFPIERFPESTHEFLRLLPLTPLIESMRRVMLEGATFLDVAPQLLVMALWGVIPFYLALRWFRWT